MAGRSIHNTFCMLALWTISACRGTKLLCPKFLLVHPDFLTPNGKELFIRKIFPQKIIFPITRNISKQQKSITLSTNSLHAKLTEGWYSRVPQIFHSH